MNVVLNVRCLEDPISSTRSLQRELDQEDATRYLIEQHGIVTVPWDDAGPFLRFSVTYVAESEVAEDELMRETIRRLKSAELRW